MLHSFVPLIQEYATINARDEISTFQHLFDCQGNEFEPLNDNDRFLYNQFCQIYRERSVLLIVRTVDRDLVRRQPHVELGKQFNSPIILSNSLYTDRLISS